MSVDLIENTIEEELVDHNRGPLDGRINHPRVSVIIPTFNRAEYISQCLDSVLAQTYSDYEIIVVDDGSTDDTAETLSRYGTKIRYLFRKNAGTCAARNIGIDNARGEYIAFLDSDDLWLPDRLEKQVSLLDTNPAIGFVCSDTYLINERGETVNMWKRGIHSHETFESLYEANYVYILTVLIRKDCLDDVGLFDENLLVCGDYDLWLRVAKKYKFKYIDIPLSKYRIHKNNISKNIPLHMRERAIVANKGQIADGIGFLRKRVRRARDYYLMAKKYTSANDPWNAGVCYFRAVLNLPFVGFYYYPIETDKFRWSLPYRIWNPYITMIKCITSVIMANMKRRMFASSSMLIICLYGLKGMINNMTAIKAKRPKVGLLNIEYFHKEAGGFGGYGSCAKNITDHFNVDDSSYKFEVILTRKHKNASIGYLHNTDVVMSPDPEGSNIANAFKYAKILNNRNIDLLISMEYCTNHQRAIFYLPKTPLLIWIRDPRPMECLKKIATCSLEVRTTWETTSDELEKHDRNIKESLRKVLKIGDLFRRKIIFAATANLLIDRAKALYGMPRMEASILPTPVRIPAMDKITYSDRPSFCFLGRWDPIKRPQTYFELARIFKDYDFFVAGTTHFPDIMDPIRKEYANFPNLKFLGHIDGQEKDEMLRSAWAVINSSVHEANPVSFLEAFSYGKQVISCQNPDGHVEEFGEFTGEILGDGINKQAIGSFSDAITRFLDKPLNDRIDKGMAARRFVSENYSFQKFDDVLADIIKGLN